MNFTKLGGFKVICYLALLIVSVALMVSLSRNIKGSLRHTGGRRQFVIDEIFIGFIVLIIFAIIVQIKPSSTISFLTEPLE